MKWRELKLWKRLPRKGGQPVRNIGGLEVLLRAREGPLRLGQLVEIGDHPVDHRRRQEIVDADMVIGFSALIFFRVFLPQIAGGAGVDQKGFGVQRVNGV